MAHLGLAELALGNVFKAQLNGGIAFLLSSLLLDDRAGSRLDDGDGNHMAVLSKIWDMPTFLPMIAFNCIFLLKGYWSA